MKTIFFKKNEPKEGYTSLVSKENTYLNDLEIGRLRLGKKGDKFSGQTKNHELLLEVLIGTCDITTKHNDSVKKFQSIGDFNEADISASGAVINYLKLTQRE